MEIHPDLPQLALIRPEERDYNLTLQESKWGTELRRWKSCDDPRHFSREVSVHTDGTIETVLHECIVPFPSAPIFGINRKAEYSKSLEERPNMHTLRVLRRPETTHIHRVFLLHNGLNEAKDMKFYYRLADWILREQPSPDGGGAACVIMPFPGHLTHYSFHGPFSETPLGRYLNDSGELFRQFLRYMVCTRWLLSIVADSDAEEWMVGGKLLKTKATDTDAFVKELFGESEAMYSASRERLKKTNEMRKRQKGTARLSDFDPGIATTDTQIDATVRLLRSALMRKDSTGTPEPLPIHVIGYSLGGFVAQSVFFAWPQIVSSCTTICSGGAINALSPTAFAHPEEWQAVLHSLRPELSNSMLQGRLGDDYREGNVPVSEVAGMPLQRFGYFQRIFEQVFLQEDRGSYKERLSEYALRMLFVSGGEDPIVPPTNILDASPKEGITMLSVAGMTHFLNQDPKTESREKEQRDFWLPEAGSLIARAAIRSEEIHIDERESAKKFKEKRYRKRKELAERLPLAEDTLSSSDEFEVALDWVLDAVDDERGLLLVCRNALPAAFINPLHFTRWGKGVHHHDVRVQQYAAGLRYRRYVLEKVVKDRTTLIIPEQLEHWFVNLTAQFDAHSDAPSGRMTTEATRERIWKGFEKKWWQCTRKFGADDTRDPNLDGSGLDEAMAEWQKIDTRHLEVTHLPDVWIGIHPDAESLFSAPSKARGEAHSDIVNWTKELLSGNAARKKALQEALKEDLEKEFLRIVQVSGAEFNPRYRGLIEKSPKPARRLLARCAAGLVRSAPMTDPESEDSDHDGR